MKYPFYYFFYINLKCFPLLNCLSCFNLVPYLKCSSLCLANEASWPSMSKSVSDWRSNSPEQVRIYFCKRHGEIIVTVIMKIVLYFHVSLSPASLWLWYLPQCQPPGGGASLPLQLPAPLGPRDTGLAPIQRCKCLLNLLFIVFLFTTNTATDLRPSKLKPRYFRVT